MAPQSNLKRKRTDDDTDEDEPGLGLRQILPVANLPADFEGEPMDGLQYLFTVRRDARRLPHITRAANPYELLPPSSESVVEGDATPVEHEQSRPSLPSDEWRAVFERRFRNFRSNTIQPTIGVQLPPMPSAAGSRKVIPDKKNREAWWAFLEGEPEDVWNPPRVPKQAKFKGGPHRYDTKTTGMTDYEDRSSADISLGGQSAASRTAGGPAEEQRKIPREPTPTMLHNIDHRISVHLLMYFTHWFNLHLESLATLSSPTPPASGSQTAQRYAPTDVHARWIFALLSRVDTFCSADEVSGLRALAKACLALVRLKRRRSLEVRGHVPVEGDVAVESVGGEDGEIVDMPDEAAAATAAPEKGAQISESSLWIILCAVVGIWGQRDLWFDAEDFLTGRLTT
ncbi:hypothetical protein BV25DRAFT_1880026 [Artomyces pyxidatus]|uniref:Uncharacterized protein n=1 Tax=Artomyces pyxidatus TaxID=48021 RepID=A0ACB8TCB2_9AGAM|nr:hypothetical protein BV25DRAFT_1880026 [Artomyces pyxidatus]